MITEQIKIDVLSVRENNVYIGRLVDYPIDIIAFAYDDKKLFINHQYLIEYKDSFKSINSDACWITEVRVISEG